MTFVIHDYDPVKRHEYYLRTRDLRGRTKALVPAAVRKTIAPVKKAPVKKSRAQRQKEMEIRIQKLEAKLKQAQLVLKALTEAAQKRAGVEKNAVEKYQDKKTSRSDPTAKYQRLTPAQKAAKAKASEKYYNENKDKILEDRVHELTNKIKAVQERIKRLKNTGSVGARK